MTLTGKIRLILAALPSVIAFQACEDGSAEKIPVARVYDSYLFSDEIESFIPKGVSQDDSLLMADSYTRDWVTQRLLLHNAEAYLSDAQKLSIARQVSAYRMSLLIHLYKQELVNKRFTATVSEQEIEAYYKANSDNFLLSTPVVKALFIIIPKEKAKNNINKIRDLFRSDTEKDRAKLEDLCISVALKYDSFDNKWIEVKSLFSLIPGDARELESAVAYKKFIEKEDEEFYYLLRIDEIKHENTIAPLEYVRDEIHLILENQNKVNFEYEIEYQINEEGLRKKNVTIY